MTLVACVSPPARRDPASVTMTLDQRAAIMPFDLTPECRAFIQGLPRDYQYGWFESEFAPGEPEKISIFYFHKPVSGKTPTIFFNGGPLSPAWNGFVNLSSRSEGIWFVFMDQRGTGCSSPLPKVLPESEENLFEVVNWGSAGIVRDAEILRAKLGVQRWNVFGQSYGAIIVQRYVQSNSTSLLKAVAHGGATFEETRELLNWRYDQQLFVIQRYFEKFPQDRARVIQIFRQKTCSQKRNLCGAELLRQLASDHLGFQFGWSRLHEEIAELSRRQEGAGARLPSNVDASGIIGNILLIPDLGMAAMADCRNFLRKVHRILGDPELAALAECWDSQHSDPLDLETTREIKRQLTEKGFEFLSNHKIRQVLETQPGLRFHLFSSDLDYYMPPAIMNRAAHEMGARVHYTKLKNSGHEDFLLKRVLDVLRD